ncbi:MAG TPA: SGNH/GDSL hydrolase family protein [Dehalococcoidia bacterium]|nr:SGNH/GDSL hydrolase family protein [Dehalococcoidia bacterium]
MRTLLPLLACIVAVAAASACGGEDNGGPAAQPVAGGAYISVGDSIAAGSGASDPARTSFAAIVGSRLNLELTNLAVAGATTSDVIDQQLAAARGTTGVRLITVSAGGNDLAALIPNATCTQDPLPDTCPLEDALARVEERLLRIVRDLRAAHPDAAIVLLAYPNFFSNTGHDFEAPAARVLPRFAETVRAVAAASGPRVAVADASRLFDGRGDELTHVLDEVFDPHPNDAGHEALAGVVAEAYRGLEAAGG